MAIVKQPLGARTAVNTPGFPTLAAGYFASTDAYPCNSTQPLDVVVEVAAATTNAPAGNKALIVYIIESLDGSSYRSGPTSGNVTTDEADLKVMGMLPMNTSTTQHRATFSVAQALGYVPFAFKIVVKNDLGVALTSGTVYAAEVSGTVV